VSGIQATEYFQQTSITTIAGIVIGRTVTQVQVPATYRYRIELAKDWNPGVSSRKMCAQTCSRAGTDSLSCFIPCGTSSCHLIATTRSDLSELPWQAKLMVFCGSGRTLTEYRCIGY
jgi:hypothetical protein